MLLDFIEISLWVRITYIAELVNNDSFLKKKKVRKREQNTYLHMVLDNIILYIEQTGYALTRYVITSSHYVGNNL